MSTNRSATRAVQRVGVLVTVGGIVALLGGGTASAHVTANTGGEPAEKGGHAAVTFRVPNEEPDANTVRLVVTFPKNNPVSSAQTKPVPGWTARVQKARLDKPVTLQNGTKVTEAVTKITWTAGPGEGLRPDQYGEFSASMAMPDNTDVMVFPANQHYDSGKVVGWTTPPPPDGAEEPEHPAPTVDLASSAGHGHGGSSDANAASTSGGSAADESTEDGAARWLGGAGLVVGALGLGFGVGATMRARKSTATREGNGSA
ncbi:MAG: DUF1775 domain-containing protein [Pseudonocardiaceae bacterium]|nr:DUF1775 domain-containing protein [Pseudonocardiaceae bacterium]